LILSLFVASIVGEILLGYYITRGITAPLKTLTLRAVEISHGEIDQEVQVASQDEIGDLAEAFNHMSRKLHQFNEELEQRVLDRTAQLQAANREMESFSYSVSHDLRAPLRAIDGFSSILMEDYAAKLPAEAVHHLRIVRSKTQEMGRLIDDLLNFSRLSRQPLSMQRIDMQQLVQTVLPNVEDMYDGQPLQISIGLLPPCQGDPALLRQVWINLLSNATKFSRHNESPHIEVNYLSNDKGTIYFVRDNGVGFDTEYANKLFGVFQRLHRAEDYEGTGVGLAIVQRIIQRHGGDVWAEGQIGKGATFYFTIGNAKQPGAVPDHQL
jgi:light-regulated signal transduction histidine kinase (bacteriophytochrome)